MRARTAFHPRSSLFAIGAVLAIVGVTVFGGALTASAAPVSVTITTPNSATTFGLVTIQGDVTWNGAGGFVAVDVVNEASTTTSFCAGSSYGAGATTWICNLVGLTVGFNTITARADDGAGAVTSNTITYILGGSNDPTIDQNNVSYQSTTSANLTGTGPAMGTVSLWAFPSVGGSAPGIQYCANAPVDSSGVWGCVVSVPALNQYTFYATAQDILGNNTLPSADSLLDFVPAKPGLTVSSLPTELSVVGTTAADGDSVGLSWQYWSDSAASATPSVFCPAGWSYAGPLPVSGVEPCSLGAPLAGAYLVSSNSFTNSAYSSNRGDLIRIPNTPVLASATANPDGTVSFTGTVSPLWSSPFSTIDGGSEVTVVTSGGVVICTGVPNPINLFSCTGGAPSGNQTFEAYATSVNFQGSPSSLDGYYDGSSGYSNTQSALVASAQHVQISSPVASSSQVWTAGPNLTISGTAQLAVPVDVSANGNVVCNDVVPVSGAWSCTVAMLPGLYSLVASQIGSLDSDAISTTMTIPAPTFVNNDPLSVPVGELAGLFGTVPFADGTIMATINGENFCSDATLTDGTWACDFDTNWGSLTPGDYTLTATQSYPGAPDVTQSMTLRVTAGLIRPAISCGFSIGGAVTVTGDPDVNTRIFAVNPGTEGGIALPGSCSGSSGTPVTQAGAWGPFLEWCSPTCSLTLAPGVYNVHYDFSDAVGVGYDFSTYDYFFTVPNTPTVSRVSEAGRASGTGTVGDRIRLVNASGVQLCTTLVTGSATWSCAVTLPSRETTARAYQVDATSGGISAYSESVALPARAAAPTATPTPTPTAGPWNLTFGDTTEFVAGERVTIEGEDIPPGSTIDIELHSTPVLLGSTTAGTDGTFSITVTIPTDTEPGEHHIVAIITTPDADAPSAVEEAVTVVDQADTGAANSGALPTTGAPSARQEPGSLSALSAGLISPLEVISNPLALATAGSLGLALVLLVLVPAEFFGEALANHYGSLGGFFARRARFKRFVDNIGDWIELNRFLAGAGLVFVTSLVFCFIDPGFGFDLTSLRLLLSCAASILLVNFLSAGITERVAEKAWKVPTRLEVMPWGLAIAIVGVIASRILDFSPGFLIGSIIGVSVVGEVTKKLEMRVILLWSSVVWGIAMAAWVLAPLVPSLPVGAPASFFTTLLSDSLTATSAAGLTALLVALLPIALFDGGELFKHSKLRWAIAFGIAVASFALVVLPSASNWLGLGDGLLGWLLLTLGFIALAIVTYLLAVRRNSMGRSRLLKGTTTQS